MRGVKGVFSRTSAPAQENDGNLETRARVVAEVLSTEQSYTGSLATLVDVYVQPLTLKPSAGGISAEQVVSLFSNIAQVLKLNKQFCLAFAEEVKKPQEEQSLGTMFLRFAPIFRLYSHYVQNHEDATTLLKKLRDSNRRFQNFCEKASAQERCSGMDLNSYLIMPIQRIPRYRMLVEELVKRTPSKFHDYIWLREAATLIAAVAGDINERVRAQENRAMIRDLEGLFAEPLALAKEGRTFHKQGPLLKKNSKGGAEKVHVLLFSDCLVVTKGKLKPGGLKVMVIMQMGVTFDLKLAGDGGGFTSAIEVGECAKRGWLEKEGGLNRSWKRRWFTLVREADHFVLSYSKTEEDLPAMHKSIIINDASSCSPGPHSRGFTLTSKPGSRVYRMQAVTQFESSEWLTAIQSAQQAGPATPSTKHRAVGGAKETPREFILLSSAVSLLFQTEERPQFEEWVSAIKKVVADRGIAPVVYQANVTGLMNKNGSNCSVCDVAFTMVKWKHHCRQCGALVCDSCSAHGERRDQEAGAEVERLCEPCMTLIQSFLSEPNTSVVGVVKESKTTQRAAGDYQGGGPAAMGGKPISIVSTTKKAKGATFFIIRVSNPDWTGACPDSEKRFSDFVAFDKLVRAKFPELLTVKDKDKPDNGKNPKTLMALPKKKMLNKSKNLIKERKEGLEAYLQQLVSFGTSNAPLRKEVGSFLGLDSKALVFGQGGRFKWLSFLTK